jgi:biopolymer transport protein ExbD
MQVQDDKPYDDINITPMLDLAYVLLVIFILMCTASVQGMKVDPVRGSEATKSLSEKKMKAIAVNSSGALFMEATPVSLQELETKLGQLKADNPNLPIVIRGDRVAQYQAVMDVMNVCGRLGITTVGIATKASK